METIDKFIEALDAYPLGTASYVPLDWPEGDPRWDVARVAMQYRDRLTALDCIVQLVREEVERHYRATLRAMIDGGVPRSAVASALGVSLAELRDLMRWP